jgi:hypothetical protein
MEPKQFLLFVAVASVVALLSYAFRSLLLVSQNREDADDEALWHYLLSYNIR